MKRILLLLIILLTMLPVQGKSDFEQILGGLIQSVTSSPQPTTPQQKSHSMGDHLVLTLRGATDSLLEAYKEEGREYAREVGDVITQRMLENEKINSTLDSVRYLCWGVIAYLTVVSLLVLLFLLRLRVLYARLTEKIDLLGK